MEKRVNKIKDVRAITKEECTKKREKKKTHWNEPREKEGEWYLYRKQ